MRVLFTTNIPSPYRVDFFNELGKACDLTVLYERSEANNRNNEWLSTKATNFKEVYLKGLKIGSDSALCPGIVKYFDEKLYDVFVVGGYCTPSGILSILYLKLKKIPFVLDFDGGFIKSNKTLRHYLKKFLISSASWWTSTGSKTSDYLCYYGAKPNNIYTYPFTSIKKDDIIKTTVEYEAKQAFRHELNMPEDKIIISVGRLVYVKGYDILLKACTKLDKNTGVYIVGGNATGEYSDMKKELNLANVHFVEFKTKDALAKYYKASDLFVLPSRGDVWGLVINEAMAYGLPVITSDHCVAGLELVKNGDNGYIVPVDDSEALAEKCLSVLTDDELRAQMSEKSLEKIQEYTIENMADRYLHIFKKISGLR